MKKGKRFLVIILSLAIALNVLVLPAATANAYTKDIASLTVEYFNHSWASASTNSYGYVSVGLSINTSDGRGNATGSNGYASIGVGLDARSGYVITSASSTHTDPDIRMRGTWYDLTDVYSFYYY